jgi:hypothetical protein
MERGKGMGGSKELAYNSVERSPREFGVIFEESKFVISLNFSFIFSIRKRIKQSVFPLIW